jgi:hypothetical protein
MGAGGVAEMVEYLPSECELPSSSPSAGGKETPMKRTHMKLKKTFPKLKYANCTEITNEYLRL